MVRYRLCVGILAVLLLVGAGALLIQQRTARSGAPSDLSTSRLSEPAGRAREGETTLDRELQRLLTLAAASNSGSRRTQLAEIRQTLDRAGTASAIRKLLDTKVDFSTGLGFKLNSAGGLDEAPSLRTFLLDYLGGLDPVAAAQYGRMILSTKESADEWALALRNLARGDDSSAGRELLSQKVTELLTYQPWQQNPAVGYLEAFDTAVFLGGTRLVPALTDLVRKQDNQAVAHAAYLSLDRMVINEPVGVLTFLESQPDLMQGREQTRANYFARADVRDPVQRQVLESYLLNPRIGPAELQHFAGLYPNANFMVSPNLLTPSNPPDRGSIAERDTESLRIVNEWIADPRFGAVSPYLEKARRRLEQFAREGAKGSR